MKLEDISGVGSSTISKLKDAGVEDFSDLGTVTQEDLEEVGVSSSKASTMMKQYEMNSIDLMSGSEFKKKRNEMERISTQMPVLDDAIGGGFLQESISAIYGKSGAGKSQLIYKCLASAVETTGKPAVIIETEANRYSGERINEISSQPGVADNIFHVGARNLDQQMLAYDKIRETIPELSMIAIDSFNSHFRTSFTGRQELSERSGEMGEHMRELISLTKHYKCPCIMAAQVYSSPQQYGSDMPYGGNIFKHEVNMLIKVGSGQGDYQSLKIENHASMPDSEVKMMIGSDITVEEM